MSISGPYSRALNLAIDAISKMNVVVVVAAGNDGSDACKFSPASASSAITVASSDNQDLRVLFPPSNTGSCVDIVAPGYFIKSTYIGGNGATAFMR